MQKAKILGRLVELDADFVLLTGAVRRLVEDLKKLLGGYAHSN